MPDAVADRIGRSPFGFYVHIPFCRVRCGYCDFNTYTAGDLAGAGGAARSSYLSSVVTEIRLARRVLGPVDLPVWTVFFGGGTPTLLPPGDLARMRTVIAEEFGLAPDAEVTTEANPDSVTRADLDALRAGGINRISFGMQSSDPQVLATLDRSHDPARVPGVVDDARAAGFEQVSLDLIYGTPGESLGQWQRSLDDALACAPNHISAYALVVEPGTALARRVRRSEVAAPDDDDLADKYLAADEALAAAGLSWYEVSNWARNEAARCRHNEGYWLGSDWWGAGPGAHSHIGGLRWWNVKHPTAYADRLLAGASPAAGSELLDLETRRFERVLLQVRLAEGLPIAELDAAGRAGVPSQVARGLVADAPLASGRVVLTRRGRLLADAVVRDLLP